MLFSQREGITPAKKAIQHGAMDDELQNALWDAICEHYLGTVYNPGDLITKETRVAYLFDLYWNSFFKKSKDTIPEIYKDAVAEIRKFFFSYHWHRVYDFLEFTLENGPDESAPDFRYDVNHFLERENSAYRFVGNQITEITSETEIAAIEEALTSTSPLAGVHAHLDAALKLLSDRKSPNFRKSMHESISAVEAICRLATGDKKAMLSDALKALEASGKLHGALKQSFVALYGYTSDDQGIRHALADAPTVTYVDAKYMLVACTAFINFIVGRCSELKIDLGKPGLRRPK